MNYDGLRHMLAGRRPIPDSLASEVRALLAEQPAPDQVSRQVAAAWEAFGEVLEAHGSPDEVSLTASTGSPAALARLRDRFMAIGVKVREG